MQKRRVVVVLLLERPFDRLEPGRTALGGPDKPSVASGCSARDGGDRLEGQNPGGKAANDLYVIPAPLSRGVDRDDVRLGSTSTPPKGQPTRACGCWHHGGVLCVYVRARVP